jgi:hypothetical protein
MTRLFRHALTSWIACLAILFGMLAPTLSHAVHTPLQLGAQLVDFPVCHAGGPTTADMRPMGAAPDPDRSPGPFQHCPFCSDGHHTPGLLPQTLAALVAVGGPVLPSLFYQAPEPLFHWAAPRSRAPPVVS